MSEELETLKSAIYSVIADLERIAADDPQEELPKEAQMRSAMYASLREQGYVVHVEATYPESKAECDLLARQEDKELWVELKRAWGLNTSGWVNKPAEQSRTWQADVEKLRRVPEDVSRIFVLFGFFDGDPRENPRGVMKRIESLHPDKKVFELPSRTFSWRESGVKTLAVWAWSF